MRFKNLKIGKRFGMGYGYMIVLTTIIGVIYINEMEVLTKKNLHFYEQAYTPKRQIELLNDYLDNSQLLSNRLIYITSENKSDSLIFLLENNQKKYNSLFISIKGNPRITAKMDVADSLFHVLKFENMKLTGLIRNNKSNEARMLYEETSLANFLKLRDELKIISQQIDLMAGDFYQGVKDRRIQIWIFMGLLFVFAFITNIWLAFAIVKTVTKPLRDFIGRVKEIALGNLDVEIEGNGNDEIGILAGTLREMQENLQHKSKMARQIANGDFAEKVKLISNNDKLGISINQIVDNFSVVVDRANKIASGDFSLDVKPDSENDELGMAMLNMLDSLKEVVSISKVVAAGDYSVMLEPKSKNDDLSIALSEMTSSLREMSRENERQNWIKTGVNGLNDKTRGELETQEMAKNIVTFLSKYLDASIGAIYLADNENTEFHLAASYAFTHRKGLQNTIKPGEGLVGQVATEKELISLVDVPDNYIRIGSSLGNQSPHNIIVAPFVFDGFVYGIIELGSFKDFSETQIEFLKTISESVAIALNTAKARWQMKTLLTKTSEQANELQNQQKELQIKNVELEEQTSALKKSEGVLQTQQEELRVSNEELEGQAIALKKSEHELQAQQEELRVTNEELEEKTKSLEIQKSEISKKNQDLEEARIQIENKAKELEFSSKYKSEFLANMSHELRTPLNSLLILSQDLANNSIGHLDENEVESAEIINKSGQDLLNLINEILDLSKIESGKMIMNFEMVSLSDIIGKSQRNFKRLIEDKGLNFKIHISENIPENIYTDVQRADQVIKNLLSNSLKFTQEGDITITCSLPVNDVDLSLSGLNSNKTLAISVKDTGIGIPHAKQREIFEAFQQADGGTSRKYGGTGLGLSISKELAKLLGGELQLESEPGKGSVFTLYLPLQNNTRQLDLNKSISSHDEKFSKKEEKVGTTNQAKKTNTELKALSIADDRNKLVKDKKTILVIEDDPQFAKILYKQCQQSGFNCIAAASGEDGLALSAEFSLDAIILDIKLPGIDGYTVLDRLKENAETRHIPVHMMSGNDENSDVFRMGAIGYLTKPVSANQLSETFVKLENYIERNVKNLLLIEDDKNIRKSIRKIIDHKDVFISEAGNGETALDMIASEQYDCMVLDLGLPDMTGFELLDKLEKENKKGIPPVIVYTGRELSQEENIKLQQYTNSIILKGVKSEERLLDETALFLHHVVADMPKNQQKIIKNLHNKEELFKGKKILIVDDDMRNVFALSKILEAKGLIITKAVNGKMALDVLNREEKFDLVLMDIMMPVMDGYEAMQNIRNDVKLRSLPLIALTAKAMKNDREKCIAAGASDYLTKPVNIDKLLSLMRVWMYK